MIPKFIHYCWFGPNPKSQLTIDCIASWKHFCPGFEIIEWNEVNSKAYSNKFYKDSLRKKKYAFVADYIRTKVLFEHGGIYMDIKLNCINGFKLIELTETEHYVLDREPPLSIHNALLVSKPGNPFFWKAICRIVMNVHIKFYGRSALDPTGPKLLGNIILRNKLNLNIDLNHYKGGGYLIYKNHFVISTDYPEYNTERTNTYNKINLKRYDKMWSERKIYK